MCSFHFQKQIPAKSYNSSFEQTDKVWGNYQKKFQPFGQTKNTCLQERIVKSHLNCFVKKAKKVVANFVFLLLQKAKNLFRQRQKRIFARSGRKESLCFLIYPQKWSKFPTFLRFWLKLFLKNFIKRIVVVGNNLFRQWRKCFTNKWEKNNNKFCWTFNNMREKATSFSQQWFYEVSANFSLFFSTKV